jgi:hypothetical protein
MVAGPRRSRAGTGTRRAPVLQSSLSEVPGTSLDSELEIKLQSRLEGRRGSHPPPAPATNAAAGTTRPCRTARSRTPRPVHAHGRRGCYAPSEGRPRCPSRTGGTSTAAQVVTSSSSPRLRRTEYPLYHSAAGPPDLDQRVGRAAGIGVPAAVASRPPRCVRPEISADCLPIRRLRGGRLRL